MARPRKTIPNTVGIDMVELASKILKMSDAEIGAWLRKAVCDCNEGCTNPDCDPFIKEQYDNTVVEIRKKQDYDARKYQQRKDGKDMQRTLQNGDSSHVTSEGNLGPAQGSISRSPEAAAQSGSVSLAGVSSKEDHGLEEMPVSLSGKAPVSTASKKMPYGTCKHVMLTDAEGHTLRETYGKHLAIAIDILDAYIENNGKAAKRYKNHAAVLRKGNWVWRNVQEIILNDKRIENASKGHKNFKAEERERNVRVLRGESADGKNIIRDEDLTPEELEAKYA